VGVSARGAERAAAGAGGPHRVHWSATNTRHDSAQQVAEPGGQRRGLLQQRAPRWRRNLIIRVVDHLSPLGVAVCMCENIQ
jgi:hypothetical protein